MAGAGVSVLLLELLTNISFQNLKSVLKASTATDCRANKQLCRRLKDKNKINATAPDIPCSDNARTVRRSLISLGWQLEENPPKCKSEFH